MRERIVSRDNSLIKLAVQLASSRAARVENKLFVCDGPSLLPEALACGVDITAVLCAEGLQLPPLPADVRVAELPDRLMRAVSPTDTPQGLVFLCRRPGTVWPGFSARGNFYF